MEFNKDLYDEEHLPIRRREIGINQDGPTETAEDPSVLEDLDDFALQPSQGPKTTRLDKTFFGPGRGSAGHLNMPFNHKYSEQGTASGKQLSGRKQRAMIALEKNIDPVDVKLLTSKKHFKGGKRKPKDRVEEE